MRSNPIKKMIPAYIFVLSCFLLCGLLGGRVVETISDSVAKDSRKCIIIDAGHGGVDGGATSCTGVLESQINLQYAQKLNDILRLVGAKTYMIRTDDRSVYTQGETIAAKKISDLKERVRIANENENTILVSIHQNYFTDSRYSGAQVFYPETEGSEELANDLQNNIRKFVSGENNRKTKASKGVYLMDKIQCTGILIECGFLSNPEEEVKLRDPVYQNQLCSVIAFTLCNYLDRAEKN